MGARSCNRAVIAVLESLLAEAYAGQLTGILAVFRGCDGSYGESCVTDDLGDMIVEARSSIIRAQTEFDTPDPAEPRAH